MRLILLLLLIAPVVVPAQSDTLRIAINPQSPPFGLPSGDTFEGVDVEVAYAIGRTLGKAVKLEEVDGAQYREILLRDPSGPDFIVAIYSITPERSLTTLFSSPYFKTNGALAILTRKNSGITSVDGLALHAYGIVDESIADAYNTAEIEERIGRKAKVKRGKNQEEVLEDFQTFRTDAIIDDVELLRNIAYHNDDYLLINDLPNNKPDEYGIGINAKYRADSTILAKINQMVSEITDSKYSKSHVQTWLERYSKPRPAEKNKILAHVIILLIAICPLLIIPFFFLKKSKSKPEPNPDPAPIPNPDDPIIRKLISESQNYLLFIANSKYHFQASLGDHPEKDAKRLRENLKKYRFSGSNIHTLFNGTREMILSALDDLANKRQSVVVPYANRITDNDNLIIYYSGHGAFTEKPERGYWIPIEGRNVPSYIPDTEVRDFVNAMSFRHILVISDSCFAGNLGMRNAGDLPSMDKFNDMMMNPSVEVLTSGLKEVPANSSFAEKLNEILESNEDPYITSSVLHAKLVQAFYKHEHYEVQLGRLETPKKKGRFVFIKEGPLDLTNPNPIPQVPDIETQLRQIFQKEGRSILSRDHLKNELALSTKEFNAAITIMEDKGIVTSWKNAEGEWVHFQ